MKESPIRLQDKTVLLFGDFNGLLQALIRDFTAQGADVGFVNTEKPQVSRFLENVNDAREVHPEFGRAAQIDVLVHDQKSAFEAVSKMAELFGRIDVLVDAKMPSLQPSPPVENASQLLLEQVTPFFKNKKRGRVVFIREDASAEPLLTGDVTKYLDESFYPWTKTLSQEWPAPSYGVNSVSVGVTEDLILKKFPQSKSIRSAFESVQKDHPRIQMVDATEITSAVMFLASSAASGVSGQTLRVTRLAG